MQYVIFISIVMTILWLYHGIKYQNSGYGAFEYYLYGKVDPLIATLIFIWDLVLRTAFCIGIIYLGGMLVKYLFLS